MEHSWSDPAQREKALRDIARIELRAGQAERAVGLAMSVRSFLQYRDDALLDLVAALAKAEEYRRALDACEKIGSHLRKAQAILTVATALAERGHLINAETLAATCGFLKSGDPLFRGGRQPFDYQDANTWVAWYDEDHQGTPVMWNERGTTNLARVAARFAVLTAQIPRVEGAPSCNGAVMAIAEAQTAAGQEEEAVSWARQLNDPESRTMGLLGVARGISGRPTQDDDDD